MIADVVVVGWIIIAIGFDWNVNIKITIHLRIFTFLHRPLVLFFSILKNSTPVGSINWYHSSFWALCVDIFLMKAYAVQNSTTVMYIFYELMKEGVERSEKRTERVRISNTNLWRKGCVWSRFLLMLHLCLNCNLCSNHKK